MLLVKSPQDIAVMREGGKILAAILKELAAYIKPGITTNEIDKLAQELVFRYGAESSFKNYIPRAALKPYPAMICLSTNDEIVHTPPSSRALKQGDIITLDFGIKHKGFHTDAAITLPIGDIDFEVARLIRVTKKALKLGIAKVRPGATTGDIGNTIQRYVESQNFSVVEDLIGHGIGRELHEEPEVPNQGKRGAGAELVEGMTICIEPMVSMGSPKIIQGENGFTWKTADGSFSAHFEHTVLVTKEGHEILTILN